MRDSRSYVRFARAQAGFTLIEVLVVVLIIGILAAIAIPSFLSQKKKADDAGAVSLVRNSETAMEAYGASNSGSYAGASASSLNSIEPSIGITSNTSNPYLSTVSATATDYTLVVDSPMSSGSFTLTKTANSIIHSCSGTGGGCVGSSW